MSKEAFGLALCASLWTGACLSQTLPDAARELQRQEQQRQELRQRQEAAPDVHLQGAPPPGLDRLPEQEAPCHVLRTIRIQGDDTFGVAGALAGPRQDDPPQGRCLGAQGIAMLLDRLNNALVAQGFITSRAQALPQDLTTGTLVLSIEPGLIGQVKAGDAGDAGRVAHLATLRALQPGQPLNLRDIEQTLENLRRNPSTDADIEITPGDAEGHSDILIHRRQGRPLRLDLALDDSGSRATGRWQGNATLSWDSPLGLSDLAYLSLGHDLGKPTGGSSNRLFHYSVPLGYWLVSATTSRNQYDQTVAGAFQNYRYSGASRQTEVQLSRVLHRGAASKTIASLKAFTRHASNFIDDTEVLVQRRRTAGWEAALQHTHYLDATVMQGQVSMRRGTGAFGAMPAPEQPFGEGSARMRLVQASLAVQTPLPFGLYYSGQWRLQFNRTPLTPQDRLCLGGRYTVRGFDGEQSLCGDRGRLIRHEVTRSVRPWGSTPVQLFGAFDAGHVSGPSAPPHALLAGTALGVRWATAFEAGSAQIEAFLGRPVRKPAWLETARTTAGLSLSASF